WRCGCRCRWAEAGGLPCPCWSACTARRSRGGRADAPSRPTTGTRRRVAVAAHAARDHRTKLELLRELVGLVAGWAPTRRFYLAVDSAYAGRALLEHRPPNVDVVSRLRGDAALWAPAPKRR